jgi:hypothetical protein
MTDTAVLVIDTLDNWGQVNTPPDLQQPAQLDVADALLDERRGHPPQSERQNAS